MGNGKGPDLGFSSLAPPKLGPEAKPERTNMDYQDSIQAELHPSLEGLKYGPGLEWLNDALNRLNAHGMNLTVKNFLSKMGDVGGANGFLLEIETALAVLAAFPNDVVSSEQTAGTAINPCDITLVTPAFRADLQCKSVSNLYSELFVEEFIAWVEVTYSTTTPGRLFELVPSRQANEQTFRDLRVWFAARWATLDLEQEYEFQDAARLGKVWITMLPSSAPGVAMAMVSSATDDPQFASDEDEELIRRHLLNRIKKARPTFGFPPSPHQFNFVVVDLPSLNVTADEESLVTALYGSETYVQVSPGNFQLLSQPNGLYMTHSNVLGHCSGVVFRDAGPIGPTPFILFPNSPHVTSVQQAWHNQGTFRLTNKISLTPSLSQ